MKNICKILPLLILLIFISACSADGYQGATMSEANKGANIEIANKLVTLISENKYDEVKKYCDENMKNMPENFIKDTWNEITAQNGLFKKILKTRSEISQGYEIVYITCEFEKGYVNVLLHFSSPNKLANMEHIIADYNATQQ